MGIKIEHYTYELGDYFRDLAELKRQQVPVQNTPIIGVPMSQKELDHLLDGVENHIPNIIKKIK